MDRKKNIALIGMPGCGKSTLGKMLSKKIEMEIIDIDKYIEEQEKKTISEIFEIGEEYFRDIESKYVSKISEYVGNVICTGGGIIKREVNIKNLKKNSIIVFIDRPLECIINDVDIDSRPLLRDNKEKIYKLFQERYELYKKYSDIHILNNKDMLDTVNAIIKKLDEIEESVGSR